MKATHVGSMSTGGAGTAVVPISRKFLAPKEHGAYGQLAFPLITAFGLTGLTVSGACLALASIALFLAHEPALVMLGHRGLRAQRRDGEVAWRSLLVLTTFAGATGGVGVALSPPVAQVAACFSVLLAGLASLVVWRHQEKTAHGEIIAAAALSSTALPVMLANGGRPTLAWGVMLLWVAVFAIATFAVRGVIAHHRQEHSQPAWLGMAAAGLGGGLLVFLLSDPSATISLGVCLTPAGLTGGVVYWFRPSARRLRQIGWSLVGTCVATAILMVGLLRA